jgi:hypothetical protein
LPIATRADSFSPYVTEGIGFFRNFITYSAQAHLRELSWMHQPRLAQGILANLGKVQRADGSFPGHNYSARPPRDFYHADFATGADQLNRIHPGALGELERAVFDRYLGYFKDARLESERGEGGCYGDACSNTDTYLIFDQNETGQEYMNRYQFLCENADRWGSFRIEGVDATTYVARMQAFVGGTSDEHVNFMRLWDERDGYFVDRVDDYLSPARPATGFYPLTLPEIPLSPRLSTEMLEKWLFDETRFWLPRGIPAEAATEPTFSAEPEWKEKRTNCPWNGRSWPMANSHVVDAAANVARQHAPQLKVKAGESFMKAIRMLFHDGDPTRPCCFEHYNPITGTPALYRGYDDYMHSWVVDLILRHAVGVLPDGSIASVGAIYLPGGWAIDPLPIGVDLECTKIPHPDGFLSVMIKNGEAKWELSPR